ncbi:MAG TPA: hypothetical protein VFM38_15365 [Candidatus Limnocylindrales bacterium]|nr:hypothetical protein [Candidatus Limnocylindrales bacterium]
MRRVRRVAKRNGIKNPSMIHPGEKIGGYKVHKGDTLYGLVKSGKVGAPGQKKKAVGAKSAATFAPGHARPRLKPPSGGSVTTVTKGRGHGVSGFQTKPIPPVRGKAKGFNPKPIPPVRGKPTSSFNPKPIPPVRLKS